MKIEKISDNQVKFTLTPDDLKERNIKLTELAYGSEKTQDLFREIMEEALEVCDFRTENTPLMIEATPLSKDSIMIIVTKVHEGLDLENKFNLSPNSKTTTKFKNKGLIEPNSNIQNEDNISIYSFDTLDDVINLSLRLNESFSGSNFLIKEQSKYFLVLQNNKDSDNLKTEILETTLNEYGQKHVSTIIAKYYLIEHGEIIIKENAIEILSKI